ncbi:YdbC family protein [uncultured Rossellomorea sp.]|uniref:YdbC family protein n=1 Tax=uncultured Rossellomorea sp. TaxID=2837549 RepID=UPI00262C160C|nr:YdbC family protein [uncultured Rossellomorea sp.]
MMMIKVITCKVSEERKEDFFEEQKIWKALSPLNGFLGQVGGWSDQDPSTACIFAFWENEEAYQYFMDNVHDEILLHSNQSSTYKSIDVSLYEESFTVPGSEKKITHVLEKAKYVRVARALVKPGHADHFIDMQKTIWNPGMSAAEGFLGGSFAISKKRVRDFLVFTCWGNERFHQIVEKHFPALVKETKMQTDVQEIMGEEVVLEEAWRVLPFNNGG